MNSQNANSEAATRSGLWSKILQNGRTTVIGTILLGVLGSAIWEVVAKPGIGSLSSFVLSSVTLGSQRVRDISYQSAALDPTTLPALLLLLLLVFLPSYYAGVFSYNVFMHKRFQLKWDLEEYKISSAETPELKAELYQALDVKNDRAIRRSNVVKLIIVILLWILSFTAFLLVNQSISIRRVFTANLAICSPALTPQQEEALLSRFASVRSETEYIALRHSLTRVANQERRVLWPGDLW